MGLTIGYIYIYIYNDIFNGHSRILKWRYVSTMFWAIFRGDIDHGKLKWPLTMGKLRSQTICSQVSIDFVLYY